MKFGKKISILAALLACLFGFLCISNDTFTIAAKADSLDYDVYDVVVKSEDYDTHKVSFLVYTGVDAKVLKITAHVRVDRDSIWEPGWQDIELKRWTDYQTLSKVVDGNRVWSVSYTFSDNSIDTVSFSASNKEAGVYSLDIYSDIFIWPDVNDIFIFDWDVVTDYSKGKISFKVSTPTFLTDEVWMYDDSGELLKKWTKTNVANYYENGDGGNWVFSYTFDDTSRRNITFYPYYKAAGTYGKGQPETVEIFCNNQPAVRKYDVTSASFANGYAAKGTAAKATVKTEKDAKYLNMYSEDGTLITTWKAADCSTLSGDTRVWNVSFKFAGTGAREMTFKASYNNTDLSAGVTAKVLITSGNSINVNSAKFASDSAAKGTAAKITVKTGADAKYLAMYNGSTKIKTWNAADCSKIEGTLRVWNVSYAFSGTGTKNMTFKASKDNATYGTEKTANILITSGSSINVFSAKFSADYAPKGTDVTIIVKTGADVKYLAMYSGTSKIKTWKAADYSKITGTTRVWIVKYSFSGTGTKNMTFKGSKDNKTFGTTKNDSILITSGNSINVTSAKFGVDYAPKGTAVTVTVKTGADAKYLVMYNGSTKIKTWKAADYSKISGTNRVWTVKYTFTGTGTKNMTFKASKDNATFGTAKNDSVLITSGSSINVNSAKFAESSVVKGTAVTITVKTGADAKYLAMFSESGGKAKTWKAADYSKISGKERVWTVTYTFSGAGNRSMTFKASKDNSTFGTGKTANIKITAN